MMQLRGCCGVAAVHAPAVEASDTMMSRHKMTGNQFGKMSSFFFFSPVYCDNWCCVNEIESFLLFPKSPPCELCVPRFSVRISGNEPRKEEKNVVR